MKFLGTARRWGLRRAICAAAILCAVWLQSAEAQENFVLFNYGIDTADAAIAGVLRAWKNYVTTAAEGLDGASNPYWSKRGLKLPAAERFRGVDLTNRAYFTPSLYHRLKQAHKATVMSVTPAPAAQSGGQEAYVVRALFALGSCAGYILPLCIAETVAVREGEEFAITNVLPLRSANWKRRAFGSLTFVSPPDFSFDEAQARSASACADTVAAALGAPAAALECYAAESRDRLFKALGYDFYVEEGNAARRRGFADARNGVIYAGGGTDCGYEVASLYLTRAYPKAHPYLLEGAAAMWGGKYGAPLAEHVRRARDFARQNPRAAREILSVQRFDGFAEPAATLGGAICLAARARGGAAAVKKLLSFGGGDADFFKAVEAVLGVKQAELNAFLLAKLDEYAAGEKK